VYLLCVSVSSCVCVINYLLLVNKAVPRLPDKAWQVCMCVLWVVTWGVANPTHTFTQTDTFTHTQGTHTHT